RERDAAKADLARAKVAVSAFRRKYPLTILASQQGLKEKSVSSIRTQIIDARSNIASIRGQLPELRKRLAREPLLIPADQTRDNPQRAQIEEKLRALKVHRVELL